MPVSDGFFKLMQKNFGFYTSLCNDFFSHLGSHVESNNLGNYLQNDVRPRLFDPAHCKEIESIKKQFLAENIKLEQFVTENRYDKDFINDLTQLKKVSEAIYELLQTHWEFYKYEKSVASNEAIIALILEIDRIGIRWDAYLEKYLAVSGLLKAAGGEVQKENFTSLSVRYHLPGNLNFTLEQCTTLIGFFEASYEFILKIHAAANDMPALEITSLNVGNPVYCELLVPTQFAESFSRFLGYLSVDVLKRETLVKFVMEIVRLQQGKEIAKTAITNFQKKISKFLNQLHPEGYFSMNEADTEDSVTLLSSMCKELDRLNIEYNDLLIGATNRLARNKLRPLSNLTPHAKKTAVTDSDENPEKPVSTVHPTAGETANPESEKPQSESTVKINIKNKEHIQYLTS
jgi:hypothetical protein